MSPRDRTLDSPRAATTPPRPAAAAAPARGVIIRDLLIFQFKLWLDGVKDVVLSPLSVVAGGLDLLFGPRPTGYRFYRVLRFGERFDLWLNLYGAAEGAERSAEGLFGASRAGKDTLLGAIEQVTGGERETRRP